MAVERVKLEVNSRNGYGSRAARRLRAEGLIPGVLYGEGKPASAFCVPEGELRRVLTGGGGTYAVLDVVLEGEQKVHHAVLKDFQLDPERGKLLHIDLHEIRLDKPIQVQVPVELLGTPEGVVQGGVLSQLVREVTVEALPVAVPDRFALEVSELMIGDSLRVGDLAAPEEVKLLDDEDLVIVTVTPPTRVEEPEVVEEEEVEEEEAVPEEEAAAEERPEGVGEAPPESEAEGSGD